MSVEALLQSVFEVIREPTGNLTAAVLMVAMLVLVVLMIVVALLLLIAPPSRGQGAEGGKGLPAAPRLLTAEEREKSEIAARRRRLATWSVVAALLAAGLVSGYVLTGTNDYCAGICHAETAMVVTWERGTHASVRCASCHEDPAPVGIPDVFGSRARQAFVSAMGGDPEGPATVSARRCLRCHEALLSKLVEDEERGLRISHAEPIDSGMNCDDCHSFTGHAVEGASGPRMSICVRCHDGESASSDCATCHMMDAARAGTATRIFGKRDLPAPKDCGGCHSQETCDECHGLRLPHPDEFMQMGHAREAAFEKKESCLRCHRGADCAECHIWPMDQHPENWRSAHTIYPFDSPCGCHQNGPLRGKAFCPVCH